MKNAKGVVDATSNSYDNTKMISVYARRRPLFEPETNKGEFDVVTIGASKSTKSSCTIPNARGLEENVGTRDVFATRPAFDEDVEEIEVYEAVKPLVEMSLKEGGSAALFMFGQTGRKDAHDVKY